MYIQNTLHIVQAWIIKYHPNIGRLLACCSSPQTKCTYIPQLLRQASRPCPFETQWRASPFCFAPWKHDKTQDKNWSASTRAMEDSSLYIFERHLDWSPKPDASSRRQLVPCSRRGGACKFGQLMWQARPTRKFLPRRDRILPQAASSEPSLHRTRFPASFLWWGMACRAWAGHRQKLPTAA